MLFVVINKYIFFYKLLFMGIFGRVINIIQSDINSILEKLEEREPKHKKNSYSNYNDWQDFQHENTESSNTTNNNNKYYDAKLSKYYANLEIPYGSDLETAKKAWKHLVRKYHPDLHSNDQSKIQIATQLTSKLNEAFKEIEKSLTANQSKS